MKKRFIERVAASAPGGDAGVGFDEAIDAYAAMGYPAFELYLRGRGSAVDLRLGAEFYRQRAARRGIRYSSLHLAPLDPQAPDGMAEALAAARLAEDLEVPVVVFNSTRKDNYEAALRAYLAATEGMRHRVLLQVHEGRALDDIDEVAALLRRFRGCERLKVLDEVGSYHAMGVPWREVLDRFGEEIALVHLKDMRGAQSVPFGAGEIDLAALIGALEGAGYRGDYVVEIDPPDRARTREAIAQAFCYLREIAEREGL